jgi:hypothetical protein
MDCHGELKLALARAEKQNKCSFIALQTEGFVGQMTGLWIWVGMEFAGLPRLAKRGMQSRSFKVVDFTTTLCWSRVNRQKGIV